MLRINGLGPSRLFALLACGVGLLCAQTAWGAKGDGYVNFESGQTRPLALSPDGRTLYALNTPAARLEVFAVKDGGLEHLGSASVGLEPVALAVHGDDEVWVVNHVSDSVSVVDVRDRGRPTVVRTLWVGDEPQDIVFAGPGRHRAFVTTAHRGQNGPFPRAEYRTEGVGRADVWVFDATDPGNGPGGTPEKVLTLFGDKPRALAVSPDGSQVYAAIFRSGNRTTVVNGDLICQGDGPCSLDGVTVPGPLPEPRANVQGIPSVAAGLIVKYEADLGEWRDELGRSWNDWVRFDLPDLDVFTIDATAPTPVVTKAHAGVGTTLFDMAVNPVSGALYVTNTEARNEVRFEGPGLLAAGIKPEGEPASVRGRLAESRVTVIDETGVRPRHLNAHIPYDAVPMPPGVADDSLATPLGMAISPDGETLFVAAFGSSSVGVFETADLEAGLVSPDRRTLIELEGGGPSGLVLHDETLFVLTRFDNSIAVVDVEKLQQVDRVALYDPEPAWVSEGRPFLYDARLTSSNGEAACASCHIFGDMDDLAWDLGNPDGVVTANPNPAVPTERSSLFAFHPMKGAMTTQTLRGLANHGAMHWRGDRVVADLESPSSEEVAFGAFNVAFEGLLGRDEGPLTAAEMQAFTTFALGITAPPNPMRRLDNQLRPDEANAHDIFMNRPNVVLGGGSCNDCHTLSPADGHFGTSGLTQNQAQIAMKVPQLRSAYQKVGMFGVPFTFQGGGYRPEHLGPQVRGFGFAHAGAIDTIFDIVDAAFFFVTEQEARDLEAFVLAFPGDLPPIVGQQVTLRADNAELVGPRIELMIERASTPWAVRGKPFSHECDLIAKARVLGEERGFWMQPDGSFRVDRAGWPNVSDADLRLMASASDTPVTYTCVPSGSGERLGLDMDEDGVLDGDEGGTSSWPAWGGGEGNTPPPGPDPAPAPPGDTWGSFEIDLQAIVDWLTSFSDAQ